MVYSIRKDGNQQGQIICSHSDHRGDVIARSDDNGSLTWFAIYEAYGTRPFEWGTNLDRQKANTKDEEAELGLLNEGMRYRDLETGTFLTRDPIRYADGPNMYCYVHCNPITSFDALGLSAKEVSKAEKDVNNNLAKVGAAMAVEGDEKANYETWKQLYDQATEQGFSYTDIIETYMNRANEMYRAARNARLEAQYELKKSFVTYQNAVKKEAFSRSPYKDMSKYDLTLGRMGGKIVLDIERNSGMFEGTSWVYDLYGQSAQEVVTGTPPPISIGVPRISPRDIAKAKALIQTGKNTAPLVTKLSSNLKGTTVFSPKTGQLSTIANDHMSSGFGRFSTGLMRGMAESTGADTTRIPVGRAGRAGYVVGQFLGNVFSN